MCSWRAGAPDVPPITSACLHQEGVRLLHTMPAMACRQAGEMLPGLDLWLVLRKSAAAGWMAAPHAAGADR